MRNRVLTILGVLLVAAFTSQIESAAAHSVRKVAWAHDHAIQQLRDAFGSWSSTDQSGYSNHRERHGLPASAGDESKSCDIIWYYKS